jgi:hypothetical protein
VANNCPVRSRSQLFHTESSLPALISPTSQRESRSPDYVRFIDGKPRVEGVRVSGGVDRTREEDALREHGADIIASDLAELLDAAGGKAAR